MAFAYPVETEAEIKDHLKILKKEYFDARHQGYAYVLGPDKERYRAFDDGEPGHSTGDPILATIRSRNLTNVLVVVVRYFGGIKLGVGGLISAYRTAAGDALNKAFIVEKEVELNLGLVYDYAATSDVLRYVKEFDLRILRQEFSEGCRMSLAVKLRHHENFMEKIKLLQALGVKVEIRDL